MSLSILQILPLKPGVIANKALISIAVFAVVFVLSKVIYRLTLHPLAGYPGPWLAGSTNLYCGYYDIFKTGGIVKKLSSLHLKYGPLIRIAPNELHVFDFDSYNEIFKIGTRYAKPHVSPTDTFSSSLLHVASPRDAKIRKDNYRPFFSPVAIRRLEPLLQSIISKWLSQLHEESMNTRVIDMSRALKCFTLDIVTQYCFAQDVGGVHAKKFVHPIIEASAALDDAFTFSRYFPALKAIVDSLASILPAVIARKIFPGAADLKIYVATCRAHLENLLKNHKEMDANNPTIFRNIIDSNKSFSPNSPLSLDTLTADAVLMVSAGMSTTAYASQVGCWHLLHQPAVLERLVKELDQAIPEVGPDWKPPPIDQLEQLPFLKAVIKESLRLSYGVPARIGRIVPANGTTVAGLSIPSGILLSHSPYVYHHDESVFPDSFAFDPDRWLLDSTAELERHLLSFSKGSRSCLGINLAHAQLTFLFAMLYRCFKVTNAGTTEKDMRWKDRFVPISNSTLRIKLIER